jgi:mannose/fructose-specific phosphotransferase system component IIA
MSAPTKLPAYWMIPAEERFAQLDAAQQNRILALLDIVRTTPTTGAFYGRTPQNRALRIVTGANAHLVYTLIYARVGQAVVVVDCFIEDWVMDAETGEVYPN